MLYPSIALFALASLVPQDGTASPLPPGRRAHKPSLIAIEETGLPVSASQIAEDGGR